MTELLPEKNIMINHYLAELASLSSEIIRIFDEIDSIVHSYKPGMHGVFSFPKIPGEFFFIQSEVFTRISSIQVHSANIKKILFPTPRKKSEAEYKYTYRVNRTDEIQKYFDLDKISEIRNSDVRNSLEHYDERLDNISIKIPNGTLSKDYHIVATNIIISSDGALYGNPYYLKCYVIDTRTYKNAEKESNLGQLILEAKYIYEITQKYKPGNHLSGSVIVLPQINS